MKQHHVEDVEKIIKSHEMIFSDFAKKILIWFFRQSEHFTKPIAVSVYTQDPDKFKRFDEASRILLHVNEAVMFSFFKERNINMHFASRGGIFLCQGTLAGFVKTPVPTKGYPRKKNGVVTHRIINQEACTIFISPWEKSFCACEILTLKLEEIDAIKL